MDKMRIARAFYYVLVFCWLLQIALQGYTSHAVLPTIVVIAYGLWLRQKSKKNK